MRHYCSDYCSLVFDVDVDIGMSTCCCYPSRKVNFRTLIQKIKNKNGKELCSPNRPHGKRAVRLWYGCQSPRGMPNCPGLIDIWSFCQSHGTFICWLVPAPAPSMHCIVRICHLEPWLPKVEPELNASCIATSSSTFHKDAEPAFLHSGWKKMYLSSRKNIFTPYWIIIRIRHSQDTVKCGVVHPVRRDY